MESDCLADLPCAVFETLGEAHLFALMAGRPDLKDIALGIHRIASFPRSLPRTSQYLDPERFQSYPLELYVLYFEDKLHRVFFTRSRR